jgi:anaerobic magnesium-protoporphyrin IX monomethyl ester cyclase
MKVCLVYPDIGGVEHYGARKFYHGLGYLSSVLKQAGHETALLYLERELDQDEFLGQVTATSASLVAFSATTHQFPYVARCAEWIRQSSPNLTTVIGGPHATLVPEDVLARSSLDLVCVGEGEHPLLDLVSALETGRDFEHIPNLWLRTGGQNIQNPLRPLLTNLDELPFADRELFGFDQILAANDGWVDLMAGRGCPYSCTYCSNPGLRERFAGLGKYVRFRSVDNVLAEIRGLAARYQVRTLNFQDDVFTLDRKWVLQFSESYGREFAFPFWINSRVERIKDEEMVAALARAGCRGVRIGLESGNEQLRTQVLKRTMSNEEIRQTFALARKYGLDVYTCNMLGIPGETANMIEETIALNRELEPAGMQFSVFYPYPMTELYDVCAHEGYLAEGEQLYSYYERKSVLRLPTLSQSELEKEYDRFEQLKIELQMKRANPTEYQAYKALLFLFQGDSRKARAVLRRLGHWREWLTSRLHWGGRGWTARAGLVSPSVRRGQVTPPSPRGEE